MRIVFTVNYLRICTSLLSSRVCEFHKGTRHEKGYYYAYSKHDVWILCLVSFLVLCCQMLWANIPYSRFWIFNDFMFIFHIPSLIVLTMILSTFFLVLRYLLEGRWSEAQMVFKTEGNYSTDNSTLLIFWGFFSKFLS